MSFPPITCSPLPARAPSSLYKRKTTVPPFQPPSIACNHLVLLFLLSLNSTAQKERDGGHRTMRPADPMPPSSDFLRRRIFSLRSAGGGKVPAVDARARPAQASDAFLIPLRLTNILFILLFFISGVFLMGRWRDKIRTSTPLHILTSAEIASTIAFFASVIYLLDFFGIVLVQSVVSRPHDDDADVVADFIPPQCPAAMPLPPKARQQQPLPADDEGVVAAVVAGAVPSYALEARLGDCKRAVVIRRAALERMTGRSLEGLPVDGFDYQSILGQCCEMPVGYVQVPVGIAGPLLLDGREFSVPMATTEGCLVASTNRGCKAIYASGGVASVLLRDGMTRAPVVRFGSVKRAAELKFFLEDPINFDTLANSFHPFFPPDPAQERICKP